MQNILFDATRSFEERIQWLLENLTVDEKLGWLASRIPGCERLGIPPFGLGGEAAHGVQGRNDQGLISQPDITTSFPQPIGMSATWDPELLEKTGGIVQGMSGSPILQDGRIIGAVTHVFVNDPTMGYGLYVEWMLEECGEI